MRSIRSRYLILVDATLLGAAPFIAYALRFEGWSWDPAQRSTAMLFARLRLPLSLTVFYAFGLYRRLWRYASIAELELIFAACATADLLGVALGAWILPA